MKVEGTPYQSIWYDSTTERVRIVDQTRLPHEFRVLDLARCSEVVEAIRSMRVRGAPLIGVSAAFGLALGLREDASPANEERCVRALLESRPTAVNLAWALETMRPRLGALRGAERALHAIEVAVRMAEEDVEVCRRLGEQGGDVLAKRWETVSQRRERLHVLTHCNTGWLAAVDWGTALAAVYRAHDAGIPLHVWVDETRPRNQGANLTAWELAAHGVPHTLITDGTAGHLMRLGEVDVCLVGSDRTTSTGDVCNKIGTYSLALAARDNDVPFHAVVPLSSIDWSAEGADVPIERRSEREVLRVHGRDPDGQPSWVEIGPPGTAAVNYAFDVTPARLVTSIVTEIGVARADAESLRALRGRAERVPR